MRRFDIALAGVVTILVAMTLWQNARIRELEIDLSGEVAYAESERESLKDDLEAQDRELQSRIDNFESAANELESRVDALELGLRTR